MTASKVRDAHAPRGVPVSPHTIDLVRCAREPAGVRDWAAAKTDEGQPVGRPTVVAFLKQSGPRQSRGMPDLLLLPDPAQRGWSCFAVKVGQSAATVRSGRISTLPRPCGQQDPDRRVRSGRCHVEMAPSAQPPFKSLPSPESRESQSD
jgi:hypothetical protein